MQLQYAKSNPLINKQYFLNFSHINNFLNLELKEIPLKNLFLLSSLHGQNHKKNVKVKLINY
jgi:hypothetical protein